MFCGKCGNKIEDGDTFCPYCGQIIGEENQSVQESRILSDEREQIEGDFIEKPIESFVEEKNEFQQVINEKNEKQPGGIVAGFLSGLAMILAISILISSIFLIKIEHENQKYSVPVIQTDSKE